jgi:hypothetical protein
MRVPWRGVGFSSAALLCAVAKIALLYCHGGAWACMYCVFAARAQPLSGVVPGCSVACKVAGHLRAWMLVLSPHQCPVVVAHGSYLENVLLCSTSNSTTGLLSLQ